MVVLMDIDPACYPPLISYTKENIGVVFILDM
jgi:hypothetical protein